MRRLSSSTLALTMILAACGSSSTSTNGGSGGAPGQLQTPTSLIQSVYYLVKDSSGTAPGKDTQVTLMFEPNGKAAMYAATPTDFLGHQGTWSFDSGKLHLKFTADDVHPDATFALDLSAQSVTMPFQVFSTDNGTSQWKRGQLSVVSATIMAFNAAASDPDQADLTPEAAVDQAYAYTQARVAAGGDVENDIVPAAATRALPGRLHADTPGKIDGTQKIKNGVVIFYDNGPPVTVTLYDWGADPKDTTALTPGPLASDPRTHLNVKPPGDGSADPPSKTALFIAPFESGRFYGNIWYDVFGKPQGAHKPSKGFDWSGDASKLTKDGYTVTQIMDKDATLPALIEALGGKSGKAPGFTIVNTHGSANGWLSTGVDLGKVGDGTTIDTNWAAMVKNLKDAGYGDLLTFDGGTEAKPTAIGKMTLSRDDVTNVTDEFVDIGPGFWKWLASKGAKFDHSMVYLAACLTDATDDLRNAIQAKAYIAWNIEVNPFLAGAVANYLVDDMVRPTHSAEEAFYNVVRVVNTRQEAFAEDKDFEQALPLHMEKDGYFLAVFDGYGFDGTKMVAYNTNGWLDHKMNTGSVWYMVWAGRWGQDAKHGAQNLVDCYNTYWKNGKNGGLASPYCNGANAGAPPTQNETGYATYILTGKQALPYSGTALPRFTLNDGKSA
jgi:hypothetical protein